MTFFNPVLSDAEGAHTLLILSGSVVSGPYWDQGTSSL